VAFGAGLRAEVERLLGAGDLLAHGGGDLLAFARRQAG